MSEYNDCEDCCARIKEILKEVFREEDIERWLNTPNLVLGYRTPQVVIDEGHADALLTALENGLDGVPS